MDRRNFIRTMGLSFASAMAADSLAGRNHPVQGHLIQFPDDVTAAVDGEQVRLSGQWQRTWTHRDLVVTLEDKGAGMAVEIQAPKTNLESVTLHWKFPRKGSSVILNDHWERTYGDVSWHRPDETEILPWYFIEFNGRDISGFGVKTGCRAFCFWQLGGDSVGLTFDTLSGGDGVQLGGRILHAAEIVTISGLSDESPFATVRRFMGRMCDKPRMPEKPAYGINDWYFSYGNTSESAILRHTEMMAPAAEGLENRPFSMIDAGWFQGPPAFPDDCCWGDNMDTPDSHFPDMGALAEKIRKIGMRPGIWTRPLCGSHRDPASLILPLIKGREAGKPVLDPTLPENIERIKGYFRLYRQWTYEMVKFDFSTFDILGKWGFEMIRDRRMTQDGWRMHDRSRTNAEIMLNLYRSIREAAGETYVIGCNTVSHLSAGLFELNRIGDDTSGQEWSRTRRMGVNALAFRGAHHGTFYAADGDCVGLTTNVPWKKNRQWMTLVAESGTPLFISAQPEATGAEQMSVIRECFNLASRELPVGEPLDWMENAVPKKWKLNGHIELFDWD
jgi:alpha-galactosidase